MSSEDIKKQQQEAAEQDALLNGLNQAAQPQRPEEEKHKVEMLEQLTESDLDATDSALQNLASKDIPSANFSDADAHEMRHYLTVMREQQRAAKPHDDQRLVGVHRKWAHDDADASKDAPTREDHIIDDSYRQGIVARITKGKDGALLGQALRSINESVLRKGDSNGSGGLLEKLR